VYTDLEAKLHDTFWEQEDVISELPLLEDFHADKLSLEIGCGSGRLLLPLLNGGTPIDGVELSAEMVELLHQNAEKQNLTSQLNSRAIYTDDIAELSAKKLERKYERVSIPAFTAQLLSREGFQNTLKQTLDYTSDDAELYLTLFIPWAEIAGELSEGDWYVDHEAPVGEAKESKAVCKTKFSINRLNQSLSRKHHYTVTHPSGKKQEHRSSQEVQWYSYQELKLVLEACGWKEKMLITDLELASATNPDVGPDPDAHILTIIAEKV